MDDPDGFAEVKTAAEQRLTLVWSKSVRHRRLTVAFSSCHGYASHSDPGTRSATGTTPEPRMVAAGRFTCPAAPRTMVQDSDVRSRIAWSAISPSAEVGT